MFRKLLIAALLVASFSATAQTSVKASYIGVKSPFSHLIRWDYAQTRYMEVFTNPDFKSEIRVNWRKMTLEYGGKTYKFQNFTNDRKKSITLKFGEGKSVVVMENYYDKEGQYYGTEFHF